MEHTCENCTRRFFVPGAGTQEVACPSCGGQMAPERDQPSGVNSDGELRNMVDPYTGVDAGGDPSTEGILAPSIAGERTQPLFKRDESFASVRTAAQTGQEVPELPVGIHSGTLKALQFCGATINGMIPDNRLVAWFSQNWIPDARAGNPAPVTVSVESDHPAYLKAALGVVRVSSQCEGNRNVPSPEFKELFAGIKSGSVPKPTWLGQYSKAAKTAADDDFDMDGWGFEDDESAPKATHKFIVDNQGTVYSLPDPTHHEQIAQNAGLDMSSFPQGLSLGVLLDNDTTEWYQHQCGLKPDQMAQSLEQHFQTPITIDPSLQASSSDERFGIQPGAKGNGRGELQIAQDPPMPRTYGVPLDRNEGLVRGGGLDQSIHMPYEHLAMEKEAIFPLAIPAAMAAARVLGPAVAKKIGPGLLKGALGKGKGPVGGVLKSLGVHSLFKGLTGGDSNGGSSAIPDPQAVAPTLQQVTHVHYADTETVDSIPALHENDGDTAQHKDGDNTNPEHDSDESGSGSMSPSGALLEHLLPTVLEYYTSDDSGENDPLIKALDALMEAEHPGYKDADDGDHSDIEHHFTELMKNHKEAAGPFYPGMGLVPGAQPAGNAAVPPRQNPPTGPLPAQNTCPSCGAVLSDDGTCAQCGYGAQGVATPGQVNQAVTPGTSPGGPYSLPPGVVGKVADTQGPYTPEQFKAVAEALLEMGRETEIPHMYDAPWEYADILAQVQNKNNEPPPAVAEPAAPPGPPAGMDPMAMMDPAAAGAPPDPAMMTARIAAAVARHSADNIAPKCPKCESHTTAINPTEDGSVCQCHACGNTWEENDIQRTAEVAQHPHDHPVMENHDVDDTVGSPHPDDNNLTWTTPDGQALTPGEEYEMHSQDYSIPDIIRVEEAKPNELVYTITGEYSELEDRTTISPQDVKEQGITFIPVGGDGQPVEELDVTEPTPAARVPITTSVDVELSDGRVVQANVIAGRIIMPATITAAVEPQPVVEKVQAPPLTEVAPEADTASQPEKADKVQPPKEAAWLLEGTSVSTAPAPWETPLPDLTGGDITQDDSDGSWLISDLPKTAGARFSPTEQRKFIDEDGEARNLDRLDLEDTHYRTRETSVYVAGRNSMRHAQPDMAPDDHLVFGL